MTSTVDLLKAFLIVFNPIAAFAIATAGGFDFRQTVSMSILVLFISATLLYWQFRVAFALLGVSVLFTLGLLDLKHFVVFAQLDVIIFLVGMMTVIGILEERHFFDYLLDTLGSRIRSGTALYAMILSMAAFMAALVDEVTSIIFITLFIIKISERLRIDPVPLVLAAVFTTNVGSSATVVGNPIGVIVALRGGFTFTDFLTWAAPNALLVLLASIVASLVLWRGYVAEINAKMGKGGIRLEIGEEIRRLQLVNWVLFLGTIGMLVLHHPLEEMLEGLLGKEKGSMKNVLLVATPMFWSAVGLLLERHKAREIVTHRVDWWTLLFFLLLFSTVGTLKYTGASVKMGEYIVAFGSYLGGFLGSAQAGTLLTIYVSQGLLTAFLDNVLAIAVLIPVVYSLYEAKGWNVFSMFWALLFSGTMAGNYTPIGSTANIIALGLMEKKGKKISFGYWLKYAIPIATLQVIMSWLWLNMIIEPRAPADYRPPPLTGE
ncbi:MAG: SLC13 family permease [Acidilobaceae archaeon]|nr:SLC13 family permease [Acidilobaceae archaeon]